VKKLFKEYEKKPLAEIGEVVLGFSRFDELEADRAAFYNTYKAGYNPRALATLFERIGNKEKSEMSPGDYATNEILSLLFGSHPPTSQRTTAIAWESNFVKAPKKDSHRETTAFTTMKSRLAKLTNTR
jgi:predicted Zn-dependent protease